MDTRTGVSTNFNLATNAQCHYSGHATIVDGTLRMCEFAILNKANTHETRVHHVETANGEVNASGFEPVAVGFVWIAEPKFQIGAGNLAVTGMNGNDKALAPLGIPNTESVNANKTYSLALLATSENEKRGQLFIDFLRDTGFGGGQDVYIKGGFKGMCDAEHAGGEVYVCNGSTPLHGGWELLPTERLIFYRYVRQLNIGVSMR